MKMLPRSGTQIGWFADSALTNKSLLLHLNPQVLRAIWPPCTVSHKVQPLLYLSNPRLVNAGNYIKTWEHIMITLSGYLPFDHQYIHLLKGTHDVVSTRPSKDGDTRTFIFSHKIPRIWSGVEEFDNNNLVRFVLMQIATKRASSPALEVTNLPVLGLKICTRVSLSLDLFISQLSLACHRSHIEVVPVCIGLISLRMRWASTSAGKSAYMIIYAHIKLMISLALGSSCSLGDMPSWSQVMRCGHVRCCSTHYMTCTSCSGSWGEWRVR